ncbi:MAG TPA: hypothetical protein VGC79_03130 [Polyangiaceae bacterium]
MSPAPTAHATTLALSAILLTTLAGCSSTAEDATARGSRYVLGSVVIQPDDKRTTYVQTIPSLDGAYTNETAIELSGNGVLMAGGRNFFVGHAEDPTWDRYSVDDSGKISKTGTMSLLNIGAQQIDYGNVYVDESTAVSVFSSPPVAIIWDPSTMKITEEVDLSQLERPGYSLETWTVSVHDGLV